MRTYLDNNNNNNSNNSTNINNSLNINNIINQQDFLQDNLQISDIDTDTDSQTDIMLNRLLKKQSNILNNNMNNLSTTNSNNNGNNNGNNNNNNISANDYQNFINHMDKINSNSNTNLIINTGTTTMTNNDSKILIPSKNNLENDVEDEDDDDLIFIKEQPVQYPNNNFFNNNYNLSSGSNTITTTANNNNNNISSVLNNNSEYLPKFYKKQRTTSLPQLPYAKLNYYNYGTSNSNNNNNNVFAVSNDDNDILINNLYTAKTQTDEELLHLVGSSSATLNGNKQISLNVETNDSNSFLSINNLSSYDQQQDSLSSDNNSNTNNKRKSDIIIDNISSNGKANDFFKTDKDGHYIFQKDDLFGSNGRFIAIKLLGQGTFGKVLKSYDERNDTFVAVKIIRSIDRYREAAKTELRILNRIQENDPNGIYQCLLLREYFDYKDHICLVSELYGKSIYDFMCSNGIARFPGSQIQAIARQLIRSVCFLHDSNIIHTDLKPENILLCDESYNEFNLPKDIVDNLSNRRRQASNGGKRKILKNPEVKIIDFGSAIFHNEYHPPVISTRHYRAPEIVLGLGWSYPCDIWSIGCILVELALGESLYPIHENFEHLAMMERINGTEIPLKLVEKMFYKYKHKLGNLPNDLNTTVIKHFDKKTGQLNWPEINKYGETVTPMKIIKRVKESCNRLDIMISKVLKVDYNDRNFSINWNLDPEENWNLIKGAIINRQYIDRETFLFWYMFVDLLNRMFEFDPTKRITAREALDHEWFDYGILDGGITNFDNKTFSSIF